MAALATPWSTELEPMKVDEIMKALRHMKVGIAVGYDRVSLEMLRGGGSILASLLYQFFNKCWKSRRVPNTRGIHTLPSSTGLPSS
ncbi:hypothetical protein EVAR_38880_1 [Eumeta japonica]|uniref:Uncharacterized protein n=1 Tax=Eumeta variegata TaxID=151549 RepID=A0A4C1X4J9_EUMVA|nr:hypothetical protein EVAR_38880_1 [Eumeta japonica]